MKRMMMMLCLPGLFVLTGMSATKKVNGITWTYTVQNGEAILGNNGDYPPWTVPQSTSGEITIPASFDGCPVTGIGNTAFFRCGALTSVKIPETVTLIDYYAFANCQSLSTIKIPSSVEMIGEGAFVECGLTSLEIAEGVKQIGPQAFEYCRSLQSVSIPSTVGSIGGSAFASCASLTSVTISEGVREIGASAFASCEKLDLLTTPSSLTNIADSAFEDCVSLTSVTLANGVKSIGSDAFFRCEELKEIQIPSSVTRIGGDAFAWCEKLATIYVEKEDADRVRGLLSASGFDASLVEFVEIVQEIKPDGEYTEKIGDYTWYFVVSAGKATIRCWPGKSAATDPSPSGEFVIPDTLGGCPVVGIGYGAFGSCNGIESVVIPESVTSIELCAFMWCSGIRRITVKSHSPVMGYFTFGGCDSLRDVYFYGDMPIFGEETFPNKGVVIHVQNGAQGWDNAIHGMEVRFEELTDAPPKRPEAKWYFVSENGSDAAEGTRLGIPLRTIQKAVDIAQNGDTVVVLPGTYEAFSCTGKVIRIVSEQGPDNTIVDGGWTNRCVTMDVGYVGRLYYQMNRDAPNAWVCNRTTELSGFTLRNGDVSNVDLYGYQGEGAGAFGGNLTNCIVEGCSAWSGWGGGCRGSVLRDCAIFGCCASSYGGGAYNCYLDRCVVSGNDSNDWGGGLCESRADNCLISDNHAEYVGGGAYMSVLRNCTVVDNIVTYSQGAGVADCEAVNSIIWNNRMRNGEAIDNWQLFNDASPAMTYTCTTPLVPGVGNIDADPCLVQPGCRLAAGSPCIDAGCEISDLGDRDCSGDARKQGLRVNLGAYETVETGCVVRVSVTRGCGTAWCEGNASDSSSLPSAVLIGSAINVEKGSVVRVEAFSGVVDPVSGAVRVESHRNFLGFYINGNRVDGPRVSDVDHGALHGKALTVVAEDGVLSVEAKFEEVTWHVSTAGNDNNDGLSWATAKRSIQTAVDLALPKDSIDVASGVYAPVQEKKGYDIQIRGVDGPASTVIDGGGTNGCVSMSFVGPTISGFTLQNGFADHGGGIYGGGASNCVVRSNYSKYGGGGAYDAQLIDCVIEDNTSSGGYGGGVYRGSATRCIVRRNSSSSYGGGAFFSYVLNSLITENSGGTGGGAYGSELVNCTVVSNNASCGAGVYGYDGEETICRNCIVWENYSGEWLDNGWATYENSLTEPEWEGAISADPQFVDAENGDYRLRPTSPCVDAGNTAYAYGPVDLAGNARVVNGIVDIGAYESSGGHEDGYYTQKVGDYTWYYCIENGEATIINWHDDFAPAVDPVPEELVVPSTLGGCPVVGIGADSLSECDEIVSVVIPEGVRWIGDWAFDGCKGLEFVRLPSSLRSIGRAAFCGCSMLSYVEMQEGLKSIGDNAFNDCVSLWSLAVPSSVATIGWQAFAFSGLTTIDLPPADIGSYAFAGCECLSHVVIPYGVETIGEGAFSSCRHLRSVVFPQSLTNIADNAFAQCAQLSSLYFKGDQPTIAAYTFPNTSLVCYIRPENVWWDLDESSHWHGLQVVKSLPDGCHEEKVGDYTWSFRIENGEAVICRGRGSGPCGPDEFGYGSAVSPVPVGMLTVPANLGGCPVVGIDSRSLSRPYGGEELTDVTFQDGLTWIGEGAFESDSSLCSVHFPSSLRKIGRSAFGYCYSLKTAELNHGLEEIGDFAFANTELSSVMVPDTVRCVGERAFSYCNLIIPLTEIEFGIGVTNIGVGVLQGDKRLSRIGVRDGNACFVSVNGGLYTADMRKLIAHVGLCSEILLPRDLEEIVNGALQEEMPDLAQIGVESGNVNFEVANGMLIDRRTYEVLCGPRTLGGALVVPEGVVAIHSSAFAGAAYESVVLPITLKRIGDYAFEGSSLQDFSIPEFVEDIGRNAFSYTGWWDNMTYDPVAQEDIYPGWIVKDGWVLDGAFDCYQDSVVFEEGVKGLSSGIPSDITGGEIGFVQLPNSLRYIGNDAFYSCLQLDVLELPEGVIRIGDYAFGSNWNLREVTLPASVESIGDYAFGWCDSLQRVNMMGNAPAVGEEPFYDSWGTVTLNVLPGSAGWDSDGSGELPSMWPADCECPTRLVCWQTPKPQIVEMMNPAGGERRIEIITDWEGTVFYTTDGSDPRVSGKIYEGPFVVTKSMTVCAYARIDGMPDSEVAVMTVDAGKAPDWFDTVARFSERSWQKDATCLLPSGCKDGFAVKSVSQGYYDDCMMLMRVRGRWAMSFMWKSSSEEGCDFGYFEVNGRPVATISGEKGWTRVLCYLDGGDDGVNELSWDYIKDESVDEGSDCIWIADVKFWEQPVACAGNFEPDAMAYDWSGGTNSGWMCATSTNVEWRALSWNGDEVGLWMFAEGPLDLTFDWMVPTTAGDDMLSLFVDNEEVDCVNGIEELENYAYVLAKTGIHSIEWRYANEGEDCSGAVVGNVSLGECSDVAWNYIEYLAYDCDEIYLEPMQDGRPCVVPEPVGDLVIPETIDGHPVVGIGERSFANCRQLTSVAIPASVWYVATSAFEGCTSLTNITIYGDVENSSFVSIDGILYEWRYDYLWQTGDEGDHLYMTIWPEGLYLEEYECPEGVVDLDWNANLRQVSRLGLSSTFVGSMFGAYGAAGLGDWPNLTGIDVADGNPTYYGDDGVLYSYRKMYYGMTDVPVRLVFWPRNKQPVALLDTVEEIEQGAFANSDKIEEIALSADIVEVSSWAFTGCSSLKRVLVSDGNDVWKSVDGVLYSDRWCICPPGYEGELVIPEGESMQYLEFDHVAKLTGIVFPASYTTAGSGYVFNTCPELRTIEFTGLPPEGMRWENFVYGSGVDRTKITIQYPTEHAEAWELAADELEQLGFIVESSVPPALSMTPLAASVAENARSGIRVRLSRTGSTWKPLVVDLSAVTLVGTSLDMPDKVEVPAGSSSTIFTVKPVDDQFVEGNRVAVLTAAADGCESGSCEIEIIDDEVPSLSLALSADSLKEGGEKIVVTVTRDLVTNEPLTVYLTGTTANRCSCPKSVTIPAGAASVTFEIEAANDDVARIAAEMTLRASAAGYGSASKTFTVEDDDIPGVTLTLTPDAAQEGGSVRAMVARVDEDDLSKAITVKLSASDPHEIASMPSSVTIPAGKVSVDFNVYLADDGRDNGDREIVLQGAILIESCGCSGQPSSGDAIEAKLTIIDNDGPALSLSVSPATMREGLDEAGFLTISHNSVLDEDLTVRISYDLESEIEVAKEVVIKAGEKSVTIPVRTLNDGVEDGSQLVTIAVEDAAGVFAPDTKWLMVTDQNLPDFSAEVDGSVSSVEAGGTFDCRLTIHNSGFADCGRAIPYAVYLLPESERDVTKGVLVSSGSIDGGLAQDALEVRTVTNVMAPSNVGHYRLGLVVDPNATITELDEANNTAWSNEIYVGPAYSARAYVALEHFERGAQVMISGSATQISGGKPATKVDVDVYIICDGIRTTLRAKTDAAGQFAVTYQPTSGVFGHCIVGACYPGEGLEDEQDTFDILGLKATSTSALVWDIALGDENTKTLSVRNPTGVDLTGFTIGNDNLPKGCELTLSAPAKLDAGDSQTFRITAKGTDLTDGVDYEPFEIVLTTAEGATLTHKAYFHCQSQKAYLRARPTLIDTTMTVGKVRTVEVEIYNDGKGDSGPVSVNFKCPDWLRIIGGNIGNLASNESAVLTFELAPTLAHGLNYNAVYSGTVGINCENGTGLALPVKFVPVSEEFGSVKVDAIDDNTYHLEGKPHLANAVVKVTNPYTQKIVATGRTDENGLWMAADLPEGKYQLTVTANNHDTYADELLIEPGRTTSVTAFLQYQSIRVSWDVKPVEITDEYDVELTLVYETNVPQPTVLTHVDTGLANKKELPVLEEGGQHVFTITLENVGLIAAKRVTLTMPTIEGYTFALADNDVVVPAKSTVEIPVLFARPAKRKMLMANALKATVVNEEIVPCKPRMSTKTYWDCGVERSYEYPTEFTHNSGLCKKVTYVVDPQPPTEYVPTRGGGAGGGYGGGGIGGGTGTTWENKGCQELEIVDCLERIKNWAKDEFEGKLIGKDGKKWLDIVRALPKFSEKLFSPSWTRVGKDDEVINSEQYPLEDRQLAELAIDAYDDQTDMTDPEAAGYRRVKNHEMQWLKDEKSAWYVSGSSITMISGLRAMLFVPKDAVSLENASEVVVAYVGTEGSLRDILADIKNGACVKTQHYDDAAEFLRIIRRHMSGKDVNFAVVGHSLGGGLASYAALVNDLSGSGVRIRTYNGAGLCASIIPDSNAEYGCGKSTRNYRTPNDPVSVPGFHNGPIYSIRGGNFSGHTAKNFGLRGLLGEDSPSRASKILWWMSMVPAHLANSANIVMDTVPNKVGAFLSVESLLADTFYCMMEHAAVGKYAAELSRAYEKLEAVQDGLAKVLKDGALVSTGDFASDEAISRILKLDLLFASRAMMIQILLGNEDDVGIVDSTVLAHALGVEDAPVASQTLHGASADWFYLGSDDYLAMSAQIASVLTDDQGEIDDETISECRAAITDPSYLMLFDRILSVAKDRTDDCSSDDDIDLNKLLEAVSVAAVVLCEMEELGFTSEYDYAASAFDMLLGANIDGSNDVCASVSLQINQTVTMTRTAFDGTLTLFNGHSSVPITDVKFEPSVLNENGDECKDLFKLLLGDEEVVGVNGSKLITCADIAAGGAGSTVVRFVPTHEAAPTEKRVYRFGGVVTYTDPFTGQKATVELTPVSLTVEPSPYLKLDYFVQRDVFSDDPDTDEIEPSVPAEIAVLVRNVGAGEAKGVTIDSAQPVMTENEKGLAIYFKLSDFDLAGSCVDGKEAHLGLFSTVNLGTIDAGESKVAQWWLTSTLQGHFVDMNAICTPRNKWNTPDTALVDTEHVDVHKLVRSVSVDDDDLPDFLVCDEKDLYGLPDEVYPAVGEPLSVRRDAKVTVSGTLAGLSPVLSVSMTASAGWNYVYVPVAGVSGYDVTEVECEGADLPSRNVWTTDRVFKDAGKSLVEDRLHLLVYFAESATKTISVGLSGNATNGPKVEAFKGVTDGALEYAVRDSLTVAFDREIDPATFGTDDLQLIRQGEYVGDLSGVAVRAVDALNRLFEISGLSGACTEKGRYELVVQCAGIRSADGLLGSVGRSVSWMLGSSGVADSFVVTREVGVAGNVFTFAFNNPSIKLTAGHLTLTKNGAHVELPPTVIIADKGLGIYEVTGLDALLAGEGTYSLSCDVCGGEAATWSDDLTPPDPATGIRIAPDEGISDTDGITCVRELTVMGGVSEDNLSVDVFCRYANNVETKLADATVVGRAFTASVNLSSDGNATLIVRSTDAAGNSADATFDVFVDAIPLTVTFGGIPEEGVVAEAIGLSFSDEIMESDIGLDCFELTRDGKTVSLSGMVFYGTDKRHFGIEGLEEVCNVDGTYVLTFASEDVRKRSSGLKKPIRSSVTWSYKCPDREPPTTGGVAIDGAGVDAAYEWGIDRVEIPFCEPVNVPELIANGLIAVAVRTDFDFIPSWNAANNVLSLAVLDEKLPRGAGKVVLDPALIKDLAGNELNCSDTTASGTDRFASSLQLTKVDSYAMPTWYGGRLAVGYKATAGEGIAKLGDEVVVSGITGSGCQGVSVCWADWDGDGVDELFVGEANGRVTLRVGATVTEIRSGGESTFGSTRAVLCAFDADGDGINESVVCGGVDGKFRRMWKTEDGSTGFEWLADAHGMPIVVAGGRSAPAFADVNHDGRIDLLTGDAKGNVWLYYGTDRAWISTPVCLIDNSKGRLSDRSRVAYGDVNADGLGDLIVGRSDGSVVALLGERRPAPAITYEIVWPITLGESVNAAQLAWEVGGASVWTPEWWDDADDGEHCAFIRNVGNNTNAWMRTTVDGPGEITFAWMCDLTSRNTKLQFFVDDVAQGVVSGLTPWTPVSVSVYGEGAHTLKWRLFTGRSGAAETDVGAVDAVAWTPAVPPTLAEALNTNLEWRTEGVVVWHGVAKDAKLDNRDAWAVVTGLGDDAVATVETRVYGNGLLMFDWAVSCEEEYDWLEVSVDGNVYTYITGDVGWLTDGVEIEGEGWHTVRWSYCKDEMDDPEMIGDNIAMLDNVVWLSEDVPPEEPQEPEKTATENTPVPVPYSVFESTSFKVYLDAASGDYESAAMAIGKNGCPIWESFVAGLDPELPDSKFAAKIEIVNGKPVVTWEPALNGTNDDGTCIKEGVRVYELKGSINLKDWSTVPKDGEAAFNFFKVEVKLPVP